MKRSNMSCTWAPGQTALQALLRPSRPRLYLAQTVCLPVACLLLQSSLILNRSSLPVTEDSFEAARTIAGGTDATALRLKDLAERRKQLVAQAGVDDSLLVTESRDLSSSTSEDRTATSVSASTSSGTISGDLGSWVPHQTEASSMAPSNISLSSSTTSL